MATMKPRPTTGASNASSNSRRVPLDKRKRTETSCDKCKSRKQKCRKEAGQGACRYCVAHNIECLTTQPRKKRLYGSVEGLGNRLALLESLVKGLLPEADVSNMEGLRQLGRSLGIRLPDTSASHGSGGEAKAAGSDTEGDESVPLLPDQQGQVQYIGPASSFAFHLKLRDLLGGGVPRAFSLFGKNAAADQEPVEREQHVLPATTPKTDCSTPAAKEAATATATAMATTPTPTPSNNVPSVESLIHVYFAHINPDYHVLHEPSFREAYEAWLVNPESADPAWLCSFLCVLLLARRVAHLTFPDDQEQLWWRRVQQLLPVVMFTSSVVAIQALMLAAVHLHNTNHRDACWNLTGTAVRIAFAIGLHQDKANTMQTPLVREIRSRLWWTLYALEVMQVSSYDRPGFLECSMTRPNENIASMASYAPPEYCKWYNSLIVHLSSACRAPKTVRANANDDSYVGPLSSASGVLRDLDRWKNAIPHHLRIDALDTSPPAFHRSLLLLHCLYHYTVYVLCRAAMLVRATILSKQGTDSTNTSLTAMSDACAESGRSLAHILLRLDAAGKFDAITHWDCWYALAAGSILVLDLVCLDKMPGADSSHSRLLLSQLAHLVRRHGKNPHMPPTLAKFASIVPELQSMFNAMNTSSSSSLFPSSSSTTPITDAGLDIHVTKPEPMRPPPPPPNPPQAVPYSSHHYTPTNGAYVFADSVPTRYFPEQNFAGEHGAYPNMRFDRSTQMNFMDFTINNPQDWNWGDFGSFLGNDGAQVLSNVHHSAAPPGPG